MKWKIQIIYEKKNPPEFYIFNCIVLFKTCHFYVKHKKTTNFQSTLYYIHNQCFYHICNLFLQNDILPEMDLLFRSKIEVMTYFYTFND